MADSSEASRRRQPGHAALILLGTAYLAGVWLEGVGSTIPSAVLPRTPLYFLQIAALFPHAAVNVIDYRAEGWLCKERRWEEIDTRAYFPLDPDDKENRFQRVMHFLRDNRPTMHALDDYIVAGHSGGSLTRSDGIDPEAQLGGVRVLSLRLPLPEPGATLTPMERKPLSSYPETLRKNFYHTPQSKRAERCGYHDPPKPKPESAGAAPRPEPVGPLIPEGDTPE